MVMPLLRNRFHYGGVVPELQAGLELAQRTLEDQSGAEIVPQIESPTSWKSGKRPARPAGPDPLFDNRLVGLHPVVRISGSQLILQAAGRDRAQVRSASVELDRTLFEGLQTGDRIELVRTGRTRPVRTPQNSKKAFTTFITGLKDRTPK
jgi:hypothetical protein